jgi:hypothetical protein
LLENAMKYVITWRRKRHGTSADYAAGQRRITDLLDSWKHPDGVVLHQVVLRAEDTGGYAVFETNDPARVAAATSAFSNFNFHIDRVCDLDPPRPAV